MRVRAIYSVVIPLAMGLRILPAGAAQIEAATLGLIPRPSQIVIGKGHWTLQPETRLVGTGSAVTEATVLSESLVLPLDRRLAVVNGRARNGDVELLVEPAHAVLGAEGYRLSVRPERVVIRAAMSTGLFYGGVTFRQLIWSAPALPGLPAQHTIPCLEIEDVPRFAWRGLLLDPARHFLPPEFIKRFIDLAALHKFNSIQLHLTDDQGWRLEIKKYPRLVEVGSQRSESPRPGNRDAGDGVPYGPFFYTQEQIRHLVAYARSRHLELVPEIEIPGHFRAALAAYPEFSCTGGPFAVRTRWGIEPDILCAGSDAAIAFVKDVLGEVCDLFPGPFIHIGGDEAPRDRWKACSRCQARMKREGRNSEAQLQTWLNGQLEQFLAGKGRRMIGWDEILEGGLTPGAAVMSWRGMSGGLAAAEAGHDVVMSPTTHCYFDYAQANDPGEPECIGGFVPLEKVYAFEPVPPRLTPGKRRHILGAQANLWSEFLMTPRHVEYFAFPRAAALAEVVWSPADPRDFRDFRRRLEIHLRHLDQLGVNYRPLSARLAEPTQTPALDRSPERRAPVGKVRVVEHALADDHGPFLGLGASYFTALWRGKHDPARLNSDLAFLAAQGFNYYRMLSMVGWFPAWDGLEIAPVTFTNRAGKVVSAWPDYWQQLGRLVDLAYDEHGLRTQITIFADAQLMPGKQARLLHLRQLLERVLPGREHKILLLELANEAWQNGFPGERGIADLREFAALLNSQTGIPVAITSNHALQEGFEKTYGGGVADLATWHFSRDRRPDDGWLPVYDCWELGDRPGFPPVISNEPIGPGSSVAAEKDPLRLAMAAAFAYAAKLPAYVFHSEAGVFGKTRFQDIPGIDQYRHILRLLPPDLANWQRFEGIDAGAPLTVYAGGQPGRYWPDVNGAPDGCVRSPANVNGARFVCLPIGIRSGGLEVQARCAMRFTAYDPLTGRALDWARLQTGERFRLPSGPGALIIMGHIRDG